MQRSFQISAQSFVLRVARKLFSALQSAWELSLFGNWWGITAFFALIALLCVWRCVVGLYGISYVVHDAAMVLDGSWRMLHGQHPHLDFNSMIGPVAYLPTAVAMKLTHSAAKSLAYGEAILGFVLATWAFVLGDGMKSLPRACYTLCVLAYTMSPAQLGLSPLLLTPGMSYNRAMYGYLSLLLLECVLNRKRLIYLAGLSSGAVIVALLFLKITGFVVGCVLLILLLPAKPQSPRRWLGFACGFLGAFVIALRYYHFHLGPVLADLRLTAGAKHVHFAELYSYDDIFLVGTLALLLLCGVAFLLRASDEAETWRLPWTAVAVAVASILAILGNWQQSELPLMTLFLIVAGDLLIQRGSRPQELMPAWNLTLAGITLFAATPILALFASLTRGLYLRDAVAPLAPHMESITLLSMVPIKRAVDYTNFINDGLSILKANRQPGEHIMSLDFTNPFSLALEIPPAPGGSTNLQYGGSFDGTHLVPAQKLFGESELVLLPTAFSDPTLSDTIPALYGPYLHTHYHLIAEAPRWELYRRN